MKWVNSLRKKTKQKSGVKILNDAGMNRFRMTNSNTKVHLFEISLFLLVLSRE